MSIAFEGPAYPGAPQPQPRGTYTTLSQYSESGMRFWTPYGPEGVVLLGSGVNGAPDNGTAYLATSGGRLGFTFISGMHFNLVSFDLAEDRPLSVAFQVVGYKSMGVTVTNSFATDGIMDGTGPAQDFQTFYFDSRFEDLYRVDILTDRWALDNLVVYVPEPSAPCLLLLGTLTAFGCSWSGSKRNRVDGG